MNYFAYGSNMARRRIEARLGGCALVGPGWVDGHALRFHKRGRDGSGKCDAFASGAAADRVYGVVFDLRDEQAEALDRFEGPHYDRRELIVACARGALAAYAYIAKASAIDPRLKPFSWYKALVLAGAVEHGLPGRYVRAIEAVGTLPDPDGARHRLHADLLGAAPRLAGARGIETPRRGEG